MPNICVVVVDGTRARFFVLEAVQTPKSASGPKLVELRDFINPESDARGRDLWSDTKTGIGRAPNSQQAHSYDDHREDHRDEFERRFAKKIVEETNGFVQAQKANTLVIAAEKQMLGFLRPAFTHHFKNTVEIREVAKDLIKLTPQELHQHLAQANILPPRQTAESRQSDHRLPNAR
jgi:protein required for attachment to host cells